MTQQKHLKRLVRDRMVRTGERYTVARRFVLQNRARSTSTDTHLPGLVPGSTALRVMLAHHGLDLSEPMVFGLAGGIGIGLFAFYYEKADFASFFLAGRHCWHDEAKYLLRACERFNMQTEVREATTPKAAERILAEVLEQYGPCVAWVDLAHLPHRGLQHLRALGGGYHIVIVYSVNATDGTVLIGDLTDVPVSVPLSLLTEARGRNKKDKYRLLAIRCGGQKAGLRERLIHALQACHRGLVGADGVKSARGNFSLDVLIRWADRLTSTKDKERWERVFAPGHRFFNGLFYLHYYIEHYGTGGGLARPLMAEFLHEASVSLKEPSLEQLSQQYSRIGELWSGLADVALPNDVPLLAQAKQLVSAYAEQFNSGGSPSELADCWQEIQDIERQVRDQFPMTPAECAELRSRLRDHVLAIHTSEIVAHEQLGLIS